MAIRHWFRRLGASGASRRYAGGVLRAAAAGESRQRILETAAHMLLDAGTADRAGAWLTGLEGNAPATLEGAVADLTHIPPPVEWCRFDLASLSREQLLDLELPLVEHLAQASPRGQLFGPLAGMRRAVWIPLRVLNPAEDRPETVGFALLAYASPGSGYPRQAVGDVTGEITMVAAWMRGRALTRQDRARMAGWQRLWEAVATPGPAADALSHVTAAVVEQTPALLAAVTVDVPGATPREPLYFLAYSGPAQQVTLAGEDGVRALVAEARTSSHAATGVIDRRPGLQPLGPGQREPASLTITAIPLAGTAGTLLAGHASGQAIPQEILAPFASAATLVMRQEELRLAVEQRDKALQSYTEVQPVPPAEPPPAPREEVELRALLDSLNAGVLIFNRATEDPGGGRLHYWNDRFAQLMGIESRRMPDVVSFPDLAAFLADRFRDPQDFGRGWHEAVAAVGEQEASLDELEVIRPTRKVVERYTRPVLDARKECIGWVEVYTDITSQRLIQSKLMQSEKMAALGQLVSGIAHELNNPLTSIMGYAQLLLGKRPLRHGRGGDDVHRGVQSIVEQAERASHIVKNLLLFARETKPERRPVDLNEIVERTLALRSYELKIENIAVELQLAPDLPPTLADTHQLQQVVLNLIVNAEQAILHSQESVQEARGRSNLGHIRIRTRALGARCLALEVADDGPGVPAEIASRVFDPFFTTKPIGVGTGLGLSIVYGIVQEHAGEIYVESPPGQGATFVVELPVATEEAGERETVPAESGETAGEEARAASGRCVLVVEDEPTVAQLIADVLGDAGHRVDTSLDGREGLEMAARNAYDLIICDLRMPRLDGRAFYQGLVRSGNPAQHRMLFITGDTLAPRALEFLERNHLTYLSKPFLVEELQHVVTQILEAEPEPARRNARPAGAGPSNGGSLRSGESSGPARLPGRRRDSGERPDAVPRYRDEVRKP
ncbi:MAG TPA: ATP-binding protein [Candidatus Acidoferrales bacterium]